MSGPVDVLERILNCGESMRDVHAAVAELMAKVERLERKAIVKGKFTASVFISDVEAVRVTLARCKGGAA